MATSAVETQVSDEPVEVVLESVLSIDIASNFRDELDEYADQRHDVVVNGEDVELADTTSLQLLLAFVMKVRQHGNSVHWREPSEVLISSARLSGLYDVLALADTV